MDEELGDNREPEKQDEKSISSDLIRGHINTIILRSLADGDKYGYEIIAEIEEKSQGQYSLKQPSLYSALKRLETQGYVTSYWGGSVGGGRRKYFSLSPEGQSIAEQNRAEWEYSRTIIDSLISDKDFDFSNPAPSMVNMRVLKSTTSRVPSRGENGEDFDFLPSFGDVQISERLEELERANAKLQAQKEELERRLGELQEQGDNGSDGDAARIEELESTIARLQAEKEELEARLEELKAREETLLTEKEEQERLLAEREAQLQDKENIAEEERRRADEVISERTTIIEEQRTIDIREREEMHAEERARYEEMLRERDERLEQERIRHEQDLKEQEERILREQETLFRRREQELLHQNYLNLVNSSSESEETAETDETPIAVAAEISADETASESDTRDYRSIVQEMYASTVQGDSNKPIEHGNARSLGGIDFQDIEAQAAKDGIRIYTSAGVMNRTKEEVSASVVHKGKALFLSALLVFIVCLIEGAIVMGLRKKYSISVALPCIMWALGLILLLATGLAYANHFGERALRRTSPALINTIVGYVLAVIVTLIIALSANIDFHAPSALASFVVIPIIYLLGILIFGITYWLQVKPKK